MGIARFTDYDGDTISITTADEDHNMVVTVRSTDREMEHSALITVQEYLSLLGIAFPEHGGHAPTGDDVIDHWRKAISSVGLHDRHVITGADLGVLVEAALEARETAKDKEAPEAAEAPPDFDAYLGDIGERFREVYAERDRQAEAVHRNIREQLARLRERTEKLVEKRASVTAQSVTGGTVRVGTLTANKVVTPSATPDTGQFLRLAMLKRIREIFPSVTPEKAMEIVRFTEEGEDD